MIYLFIIFIYFLNEVFFKKKLLIDNIEFSKHKSFINRKKVPTTGGLFFLLLIIFFYEDLNILSFVIFFLIYLVGFFSDNIKNFSPFLRLLFQILLSFIFIYYIDIYITDVRIDFINSIFENYIFISFLFTVFCIIVFINGVNFIDGNNLNAIGYLILIYSSIFIISIINNLNFDQAFLIKILFFLLTIYLMNLFDKIQLGDSGCYLLGFFTAFYLINFINNNYLVSPYFAVYILWYPCFENLFSIIRKIYQNKGISKADNLHLHHGIFLNLKISNNNNLNNLTGFYLNIINAIIFIIGIINFNSTKILILMLIINIILYVVFYNFLIKRIFKKKIFK